MVVNPVNDAPVAVADGLYGCPTEMEVVVPPPAVCLPEGVLCNDTDLESDPLTADLVTDAGHGSVALAADGSFTYTPDADYHGPDSFTYRAYDGSAYSAPATVSIDVDSGE